MALSNMDLSMRSKVVKFYKYRTAIVTDIFMTTDRNTDTINAFEKTLARELGERPDNHTVYAIKAKNNGNDIDIYIACDDDHYNIGFGVEETNY